jgi:hypothetical protein
MEASEYERQVFINCPFDAQYQELFEAITFAVFDCGFLPRCAREADDGSQVRIAKIFDIIESCKFGIHDLSRTELDPESHLPRFNMPLELGIFLGAKRFGTGGQRQKICLILDREPFRYQKFISDIAGQDIHPHGGTVAAAIRCVRDCLRSATPKVSIPGGDTIGERHAAFSRQLPSICASLHLSRDRLTFADLIWTISEWLKKNAW